MLKYLWWRVHDFFVILYQNCIGKYSKEQKAKFRSLEDLKGNIDQMKRNRPHLMTMQEYAETLAYLSGRSKEKPKFVLLPLEQYPAGWKMVEDEEQRASAFPIEGPKLSLRLPGPKREPLGMRNCHFI